MMWVVVGLTTWAYDYSPDTTYGGKEADWWGSRLIVDAGGKIVSAGSVSFSGKTYGFILWVDYDGTPQRARLLSAGGDIFIKSIAKSRRGFLLAGYLDSSGSYLPLLINLDTLGNVVWAKTYGSGGSILSVDAVAGRGFVALKSDGTVIRLDTNGSLLWARWIPNSVPQVIMYDRGKIVIAGGHLYRSGSPATCTRPFLASFDTSGSLLWNKWYVKDICSHTSYHDGRFLGIVSHSRGYVMVGFNEILIGHRSDKLSLIVFTDSVGNLIWGKTYNIVPSVWGFPEWLTGVTLVPDGIVASGFAFIPPRNFYQVLKLSPYGDVVWHKISDQGPTNTTVRTYDGGVVVGDGFRMYKMSYDGFMAPSCLTDTSLTYSDVTLYGTDTTFSAVYTSVSERTVPVLSVPVGVIATEKCTPFGGDDGLNVTERRVSRGGVIKGIYDITGRKALCVSRRRILIVNGRKILLVR